MRAMSGRRIKLRGCEGVKAHERESQRPGSKSKRLQDGQAGDLDISSVLLEYRKPLLGRPAILLRRPNEKIF